MMAIPSGASGWSTSQRWIRKSRPGSHSKVARALEASAGSGANPAVMVHAPTNGSRASRDPCMMEFSSRRSLSVRIGVVMGSVIHDGC